MPEIGRYLFDRFELCPLERRLWCDGKPVMLGERAFEILLKLLEHPGRTLSKRELLEWVWPSVIVGENNLQKQICALRRALGDGIIATIPRYGYRLRTRVRHPSPGGLDPEGDIGAQAGLQNTAATLEHHTLARALADTGTAILLVVLNHGEQSSSSVDELLSAMLAVKPGIRIFSTNRRKLPRSPG